MKIFIIMRLLDKRSFLLSYTIALTIFIVLSLIIGTLYSAIQLSQSIIIPTNIKNMIIIGSLTYTPYTSLLYTPKIAASLGVSNDKIIHEIIGLLVIKGNPVTLRGIEAGKSSIIIGNYTITGSEFSGDCIGCIWLGEEAAKKTGLKPGDLCKVYSPYTGEEYPLYIAGIIHTNTITKYEAVTNIFTARILRGVSPEDSSYIIIKTSNESEYQNIAEKITKRGLPEKSIIEKILYYAVSRNGRNYLLKQYPTPIDVFVARLGISRTIMHFVIGILLSLSIIGLIYTGNTLVYTHNNLSRILEYVGVDNSIFKTSIITTALITVALSWMTSIVVTTLLKNYIRINFFGYPLHPEVFMSAMLGLLFMVLLSLIIGVVTGKASG